MSQSVYFQANISS